MRRAYVPEHLSPLSPVYIKSKRWEAGKTQGNVREFEVPAPSGSGDSGMGWDAYTSTGVRTCSVSAPPAMCQTVVANRSTK